MLHAQDGERAAHPHRVQGLLHCAEAGGLQHPEYCSPGHLRDLWGGFFNNVFSCELSPGGSCCIRLIVEDNLHPPSALGWFHLLVFNNEGKELGVSVLL